jgi:hypothetical protein
MSDQIEALGQLWAWFAETVRESSPLYETIARGVARDRELLELVQAAPPTGHLPQSLLAAVHYQLLDGFDHPLAQVYAARSDADPVPLFRDVCETRRDEVLGLLTTRRVQTNDCGRSALIGPGLTWLAAQLDEPLALVDVGASAGLNLLCDRYRIDYGEHGTTGPIDSPVEISCRVVGGHPPIADRLPSFAARVGLDRSPVDLRDPDDVRWLLACVPPDSGRLERTAASIRLAQDDLPPVVAGDANEDLPEVLAGLPAGCAAIVVTTWSFSYLSVEERRRFVAVLEAASQARPVAWLSGDGAGVVAGFAAPDHDRTTADVLGAVVFTRGASRPQRLAYVQTHGGWLDWRAPSMPAA